MASTIFSGNEVKTLKDTLSLNDKAKVIPVNADPTSGAGVTAPIGSLALDYLSGKVYRKTGSLATEWQSLGSGVGGINYIANSDAESGTTGWVGFNEGTGSAVPVGGGVGGTLTGVTFTRSTTTPLRGIADFVLSKDAANRQGQGVGYEFNIDNADQAKVMTISFDYEILSGTFSTGDITIWAVGPTQLIQPAGYQVQAVTVGTKNRLIATFQTESNANNYRLLIFISSSSASAFSIAFDNIQVGPQVVQYGAPITDWQSYTPTFNGYGTPTGVDFKWRRVGSDIQVRGSFTPSSVSGVEARIGLPSGLSATTDTNENVIVGTYGRSTSATSHGGFILKQNATAYMLFSVADTFSPSASTSTSPALANQTTSAGGDRLSVEFFCPILGWSSTVQMSNDTDTRVVAMRVTKAASQTGINTNNSFVKLAFDTISSDTHGAWSTANNRYVASVPGYYEFSACVSINATNTLANNYGVSFYKNGTVFESSDLRRLAAVTQYFRMNAKSSAIYLNAGDYVELFFFGEGNNSASTLSTDAANTWFSAFRLSGPSAIAASETVAAAYYLPADQSAGATTPINLSSKIFDTHGAVTTGSGWVFTAPIAGKYEVASYTYATTSAYNIILWKNGSAHMNYAGGTSGQPATASCTVDLLAGDTLQLRPNTTVTIKGNSVLSTGDAAKVFIKRIGN